MKLSVLPVCLTPIDLVSLWGGIPKDPIDISEMRMCQQKKGIKFMPVDICRINKADVSLDFKALAEIMDKAESGELTGDALDEGQSIR